jgi:hypothetical protein
MSATGTVQKDFFFLLIFLPTATPHSGSQFGIFPSRGGHRMTAIRQSSGPADDSVGLLFPHRHGKGQGGGH